MLRNLFAQPKPILAMLHLNGDTRDDKLTRALREADIYAECGVDAVIVEDYFGDVTDVENALALLRRERPQYVVGVNVLDDFTRSYELAAQYGASFMQVDSICGHLTPANEHHYFDMIERYRADGRVAVIGGVRFKYQEYLSGRSLAEDLAIGRRHCDAIAVTGSGTGVDTDSDKIREFRLHLGAFPLVVGAGMTMAHVKEKLALADAAIVGSTFKDTRKDSGEVSLTHVMEFMDAVRREFR
ncbi:MAG: BtpA/SgcQ family protein [Chloroflexota bacterium]|jgi:predicted TIM-barrel enzyme